MQRPAEHPPARATSAAGKALGEPILYGVHLHQHQLHTRAGEAEDVNGTSSW